MLTKKCSPQTPMPSSDALRHQPRRWWEWMEKGTEKREEEESKQANIKWLGQTLLLQAAATGTYLEKATARIGHGSEVALVPTAPCVPVQAWRPEGSSSGQASSLAARRAELELGWTNP